MKKEFLLFALPVALFSMASCGDVEETDADIQGVDVDGKVDGYTYVDLGLASGAKWATYNVGAQLPKQYGTYFAWGETLGKDYYATNSYKYYDYYYTKYTSDDDLMVLEPGDDAATVNWGQNWRMPTTKEMRELVAGCTWTWSDGFKGTNVKGYIGTSRKNSKTIFLAAGGYMEQNGIAEDEGYACHFWTGSNDIQYTAYAYALRMSSYGDFDQDSRLRYYGRNVRAVVK